MTFAPQTIKDAMAVWVSNEGTNSGIVGDAAHASRSSYHNGWDVASKLAGSTDMAVVAKGDYSYRLARDKVKSDAAAAMDLGQLHGSLANLRKFSSWFVAQAEANRTKYRDVREVIWSPDGKVVKRYSGPDNRVYDVPLDNDVARSHLWHTHISFYRDSENSDKRLLFTPYFAPVPVPDTSTEEPMGLQFALDITAATTAEARGAAIGTASIVGAGHDLINPALGKADILNVADGLPLGVCLLGTAVDAMPGIAKGERLVAYNAGPAGAAPVHVSPLRDIGQTWKPIGATGDKTHAIEVRIDGAPVYSKSV